MTNFNKGWTDERIQMLKELYEHGLSASQIAAEIGGGFSRSAIIGKVHRLGLKLRGQTRTKPKAPANPKRRATPKPQWGQIPRTNAATHEKRLAEVEALKGRLFEPDEDREFPNACGFFDREGCRWPMNDPGNILDHMVCNDPTEPEGGRYFNGRVYCEYHARMAIQGAAVRKQRETLAAKKQAREHALTNSLE